MLYCTFGDTEPERYFRGSCQIHLWLQIAGGGITEGGKASPSRPQRGVSGRFLLSPSFLTSSPQFRSILYYAKKRKEGGKSTELERKGNLAAR